MRKDQAEYNLYMKNYMNARYARRRVEAITKLGGCCVECGSEEELEFDHIEPHTKETSIAKASSFSEERWQAEVDKCQLLCHSCHVNKHSSQYPCGTPQRYWRGCKCEECKEANTIHNRQYKIARKHAS